MKNPKFTKAKTLHSQLESILMDSQEFKDTEQFALIVDGLSKVIGLLNELKIKYIKDLQSSDKSSNLE